MKTKRLAKCYATANFWGYKLPISRDCVWQDHDPAEHITCETEEELKRSCCGHTLVQDEFVSWLLEVRGA